LPMMTMMTMISMLCLHKQQRVEVHRTQIKL